MPEIYHTKKPNPYDFFFRIGLPSIAAVLLFISLLFGIVLPSYENVIMDRKREMVQEQVRSVISILQELDRRAKNSEVTLSSAQMEAKRITSTIRYGKENKDYFWITDLEPKMLAHPYRPDLIDKNLKDFTDTQGKHLFVELTKKRGSGFVDYYWQWMDEPTKIVPKISYVELFEPWGWIVGTGIYVEDVKQEINSLIKNLALSMAAILLIVMGIIAFIASQSYKIDRRRRITEHNLRITRSKYRLLADTAENGILMWSNGKIIFSNKVAQTILGFSSQDFAQIKPEELVKNPFLLDIIQKNKISKNPQLNVILFRKDKTPINSIVTVYPFVVGNTQGIILSIKPTPLISNKHSLHLSEQSEIIGEHLTDAVFKQAIVGWHFADLSAELFAYPIRILDENKAIILSKSLPIGPHMLEHITNTDVEQSQTLLFNSTKTSATCYDDASLKQKPDNIPVLRDSKQITLLESIIELQKNCNEAIIIHNQATDEYKYFKRLSSFEKLPAFPFKIINSILTAETIDEISAVLTQVPIYISNLCYANIPILSTTKLLTLISEATIIQAIKMAIKQLGSPPCGFSFFCIWKYRQI